MSKQFYQYVGDITQEMIATYKEEERKTYERACIFPSRNKIIGIINYLRELFYPWHFGEQEFYNTTIHYYTGNLLMQIENEVNKQVQLALLMQQEGEQPCDPKQVEERATEISCAFMATLPSIRKKLYKDVQATFEGDPAAPDLDEIIYAYPGVFAMMVYRVAFELRRLEVPLMPRIMTEYAHSRTGIDINPGAQIGEYFCIDHGTGIVIGETTVIGEYVKVYQGVTLGALSTRGGQTLRDVKRHPTIEDRVTIYSNASILGGNTVIGHDSIIGGNTFITKSIPPNTKVNSLYQHEEVLGD